jgi:hypothetical protein
VDRRRGMAPVDQRAGDRDGRHDVARGATPCDQREAPSAPPAPLPMLRHERPSGRPGSGWPGGPRRAASRRPSC